MKIGTLEFICHATLQPPSRRERWDQFKPVTDPGGALLLPGSGLPVRRSVAFFQLPSSSPVSARAKASFLAFLTFFNFLSFQKLKTFFKRSAIVMAIKDLINTVPSLCLDWL